jgi:hypothetical protein
VNKSKDWSLRKKMMARATRSPSYPSISLPEAITRLQAFWDNEGNNPADREVIAQAIGYSSRNGSSDAVIAAMSQYGLFEETTNKHLRVSELGLDIILNEAGDDRRAYAIKKSALLPDLFNELATQFKDNKASDRNLEYYLVKRGFNPTAASKAIRSYRDTISFMNKEAHNLRMTNPIERSEETVQSQLIPTTSYSEFSSMQNTIEPRTVRIPIDDETDVELLFRGQLTDEVIETVIEHLEIMKKRFAKRGRSSMSDREETIEF